MKSNIDSIHYQSQWYGLFCGVLCTSINHSSENSTTHSSTQFVQSTTSSNRVTIRNIFSNRLFTKTRQVVSGRTIESEENASSCHAHNKYINSPVCSSQLRLQFRQYGEMRYENEGSQQWSRRVLRSLFPKLKRVLGKAIKGI